MPTCFMTFNANLAHLVDTPGVRLCCHGGRRYIRHKVEALNLALWKTGTQRGWGASGATGYRTEPPSMGWGGRGRRASFASPLRHLPPRTL